MAEYYAVVRSKNDLTHYGVRGMKWGVRKAFAYGNEKKLDKTYKKASKKLQKLNNKADVEKQKAMAKVHGKEAAISGLATLGTGGLAAYTAGFAKPKVTGTMDVFTVENGNTVRKKIETIKEGNVIPHAISVGLTAAGVGKTAYHIGKALAAKHRTTASGHAKAVAKRDDWKKEMKSAFKGTKYDASTGSLKKRRRG